MQSGAMQRPTRPGRQPGIARGVSQQAMGPRGGMAQPRPNAAQPRQPSYKLSPAARNQPAPGAVIGQPPVAQAEGGMPMQVC